MEYVLPDCAQYEEQRKLLLRRYILIGLPCFSTQELLLPDILQRLVQRLCKALLEILRNAGLEDCF